jgi:TonB family protein
VSEVRTDAPPAPPTLFAPFLIVSLAIHAIVIGVLVWALAVPPAVSSGTGRIRITATLPVPARDPAPLPESWGEPEPLPPEEDPPVPDVPRLPPAPLDGHDELLPLAQEIEDFEGLAAPSLEAARALGRSPSSPRAPSPAAPPAAKPPTAKPPAARPPIPAAGPARAAPLVPIYHPTYYPREARRLRLEGRAEVEVLVSAAGLVVRANLYASSGHGILDDAALTTARQWRFRPPGRLRRVVIPFRFDPDGVR